MQRKELQLLLAQDETQKVIKELLAEAEKAKDNETHYELVILSGHFSKMQKSQLIGTSSESEIRINSAKINEALLKIIDRIPFQPSSVKQPAKSIPKKINWLAFSIPVIVVLFIFIYKMLPFSGNDTLSLTIYVHGSGGQQDYVLVNEGKLILDFETKREELKIGENGRTVLTEIPSKFKNQTIPVFVQADGFEAANPDKLYKLDGKPIYFEVQPDSKSRLINGMVKSQDGAIGIPNVQVTIDNGITISTDELGKFSYTMKKTEVKEKYDLSFYKEGYKPHREFYYPGKAGDFRLMEK